MSALLCDILQDSVALADNPLENNSNKTFQTVPFDNPLNASNTDIKSLHLPLSVAALVDLGSGLGHLPRRVLQRLEEGSSAIQGVAVEGDSNLHSTALEMELKEPVPEKRLIRILARIEKNSIEQFIDQ